MAYGKMANVYDQLMADMPYSDWVEWVAQQVPAKAATIVDLGCGTGNVAIPLSQKGYNVVGIDLSDSMLAVAAQKAGTLPITWLEQDMVEWQVDEAVDAVVCLCDGLNYLIDETEFVRAIQTTADQLKPGGVFLFDLLTAQQMRDYAEGQPYQMDEPDLAYLWTCDWDESEATIEHALTFFVQADDGRFDRFEESHAERAYDLKFVRSVLEQAGFGAIEMTSDIGRGPADEANMRVFVKAIKM
jgi:SAM-dependent methyltransferase